MAQNNYLIHYGVKGMKWGVRKTPEQLGSHRQYRNTVREAKARRKERDREIARRYDAFEKAIEKPYKKGQLLSEQDASRLNKVDEQARKDWKASKDQYKKDKMMAKSQLAERRRQKLNTMLSVSKNYTGSRRSNALKDARRKDINKMSNQELQDTINRLNLERNYRSLTKVDYMKGQKYAADYLKMEGTYNGVKSSYAVKKGKKALATAYATAKISGYA